MDFHGGEMETAMVMAIDESLVDLESSVPGNHKYTRKGKKLSFGGSVALPWMGEDFITEEGKPIGIGGDPSGATAEKGEIILDESAKEAVQGIMEIAEII
jgi:creatinine amidohydrolase/Fe(II)-dependent formamide hydrolase-like protein